MQNSRGFAEPYAVFNADQAGEDPHGAHDEVGVLFEVLQCVLHGGRVSEAAAQGQGGGVRVPAGGGRRATTRVAPTSGARGWLGKGAQRQLSGDSLDSSPIGVRGRPFAGMPRGWARYAKVSARDGVTGRAGCAGARRQRRLGLCQLVGRQWRIISDDSADYALGGGCPSVDSSFWELHICVPTPLPSRWRPDVVWPHRV